MCGIFGHIGQSDSIKKSLDGLKFLEYRGYDSAGIVSITEKKLLCVKKQGSLDGLTSELGQFPPNCQISIGHTRWATHGKANDTNAHPHLDSSESIAIVHNGILENHNELRSFLIEEGCRFVSETDSEVIAHLISWHYQGDLVDALRKALSKMRGFWALAVIHKDHPEEIVTTRFENPLVIGLDPENNEGFLASDVYAFQRQDLDFYYLKNHEVASVRKGTIQITDANRNPVTPVPQKVSLPSYKIDKGTFSHFMLKEIFEQPLAVRSAIDNPKIAGLARDLFAEGTYDHILFLGCGTSWHAGSIAALQFEASYPCTARAEIASEFRFKKSLLPPKTLVVALSQSGETFDTIAAVRAAQTQGIKVLAICNVPGSTLMREADYSIHLQAGPEISVCSTKAFSCQLAVLSLLTGQAEVDTMPRLIQSVLDQEEALIHVARKYAPLSSFFFIGRQYMYPSCQEAALKLKEISYQNAFAYPAGELKHGPIALVDEQCLVIGLLGNETTYEKMLSNLMEVKARGGKILAFAPVGAKEIETIADDIIWLPKTPDPLSPIPYSVATQLLAYFIAKQRGTEIDKPRNLAKSVTVE